MADNQFCYLEEKFPRIAQQLTLLWGHPEMEKFFEKLWIDDRGDRQGFPAECMTELMFVASLHQAAFPGVYQGQDFANRATKNLYSR
jgi:hypothetical protein